MIKMYGFWRSAAAFRVRIALNLKGLPYEETMIDLDAGQQLTAEYKKVNSQASVPSVIIDDGPPLTQSLAILEYLDEIYPQPALLPADAREKARVRAIALIFAADYHPLIVPRVRRYLGEKLGIPDDAKTEWVRYWFCEGLVQGEAVLANDPATGRYCHGDSVTIADLCLMSQVMGAKRFGVDIAEFPTVGRISQACLEIEAVARALPMRQPGAAAH